MFSILVVCFSLRRHCLFSPWILAANLLFGGGSASEASEEFTRGAARHSPTLFVNTYPLASGQPHALEKESNNEYRTNVEKESAERVEGAHRRSTREADMRKKTQQIAESAYDVQEKPSRNLGRRRADSKGAVLVPIYSSLWKGKFISPHKPAIPVKMPYPIIVPDISKIIPKGATPKAPLKMLPTFPARRHLDEQPEIKVSRKSHENIEKRTEVKRASSLGCFAKDRSHPSGTESLREPISSTMQPLLLLPMSRVDELLRGGESQLSLPTYVRQKNVTSGDVVDDQALEEIVGSVADLKLQVHSEVKDPTHGSRSSGPPLYSDGHDNEELEDERDGWLEATGGGAAIEEKLANLQCGAAPAPAARKNCHGSSERISASQAIDDSTLSAPEREKATRQNEVNDTAADGDAPEAGGVVGSEAVNGAHENTGDFGIRSSVGPAETTVKGPTVPSTNGKAPEESRPVLEQDGPLPFTESSSQLAEEHVPTEDRKEQLRGSSSSGQNMGQLVKSADPENRGLVNGDRNIKEPTHEDIYVPHELRGTDERSRQGGDRASNTEGGRETLLDQGEFSLSGFETAHDDARTDDTSKFNSARSGAELRKSSDANEEGTASTDELPPQYASIPLSFKEEENTASDSGAAAAADDPSPAGRCSGSSSRRHPVVRDVERGNLRTVESSIQRDQEIRKLLIWKKRYTAGKNPWSVRARAQNSMVFYYPPPKKFDLGQEPVQNFLQGNLPSLRPPPPCYGAGCYRRLVEKFHHMPTVQIAAAQPVQSVPAGPTAAVQPLPVVLLFEERRRKKREKPERPLKPPRPPKPERVEEPPTVRYIPISKEYVPLMAWPAGHPMTPLHYSHTGDAYDDFPFDTALFGNVGGDEMTSYNGPTSYGYERPSSRESTGDPAVTHTRPSDTSSSRPSRGTNGSTSVTHSGPPSSSAAADSSAVSTPAAGNGAESFPSVPPEIL